MGIKVQQPGLAGLYGGAAISAAEKKRARELEQRAIRQQEQQARKEEIQADFKYKAAIRQQDMAIDLQMNERAKMWEIEKMELRSRMDFQREEQKRQRELDRIDSAIQQIDKEVMAGRITEQEAYPIKQKLEISKTGVSVPISAFGGDEDERFGVQPYWMKGRDAPEGTPERQLYDTKIAQGISGERGGTVPWDLSPKYIRTAAAEESRVNRGIFLEPEDIEEFIGRGEAELPLANKQLDVGVQTGGAAGGVTEQIKVISPNGIEGTIPAEDLADALAEGYTIFESPTVKKVPKQSWTEKFRSGEFTRNVKIARDWR